MNYFKKISPSLVAFLIIVYLSFTFTGCPSAPPTETLEVTEETIEEVTKERNHPPKAVAGENLEIEVGVSALLNGAGSSDPDGDILTYTWDFGNGIKAYKKYVYVKYDETGAYTITLTVSDGEYEDSDTLTVFSYFCKTKGF